MSETDMSNRIKEIDELRARLASVERVVEALEDSTSLLESTRDENDEGNIAQQIKDNKAALAATHAAQSESGGAT